MSSPNSVPEKYEALYQDLYPHDEKRRKYYAMCTAIDDAVGDLLKTLDDKGIAENTLVVFTSEHGHLFDHRWNDHSKRLCYDIVARIPLLMRFPAAIASGGEERCVVSDDWKLILSTVRKPELYHLPSDPGEWQNRWQEMASSETVANLKAHLQAWANKTRDKLAPVLLTKI